MKIAMIGTRGVPARYGGFETAVEEVGLRLVEAGHEVVVFCRGDEDRPETYRGMRLVHLPAIRTKVAETLSHSLASAVHPEARSADVAIVFNAANAPVVPILRKAGVPVAVHVDGLEWQRSKWSGFGQEYYRRAERWAVRWADELIADAEGIADYYRARHGTETRMIAYGAPIVDSPAFDRLGELGVEPGRYHLVVARSEPENHVHLILEGYSASAATLPMLVVGSAPYSVGYVQQLHDLAEADPRVTMLGGVWDQELLDALYAGSATYFHGHSVGGTNPSLLRAMGAAAPCAAYDVVFNREVLADTGTFWRTPADVTATVEAAEADRTSARLLGKAAQARAAESYTWSQVARGYEQMCEDLAGGWSRLTPVTRSRRRDVRSGSGVRRLAGRQVRVGAQSVPEGGPADAPVHRGRVLAVHPSPDLYGADLMLVRSLTAMGSHGFDVELVVPEDGPLLERLDGSGTTVTVTPFPVLRKGLLSPAALLLLVGRLPWDVLSLVRRIRASDPDVVYVNTLTMPHWLLAARIAGVPSICHVRELEDQLSRPMNRALTAPLLLATRLVANSRATSEHLAGCWSALRQSTVVVYNGLDFPPPVDRRPVSAPIRLTLVGRLNPRKGQDVAVAALRGLVDRGYDVELECVGSAFRGYEWYPEQLTETATALGVGGRLRLAGFQSSVWECLERSDIVLVPSRVEPFGGVAVEAMATGAPVVVSKVGGLTEIVDHDRTGLVVPPDDVEALVAAVARLIDDPAARRELGLAGRAEVRSRFTRERYEVRLIAVLSRSMSGGALRRRRAR